MKESKIFKNVLLSYEAQKDLDKKLLEACRYGTVEEVKELLEQGADAKAYFHTLNYGFPIHNATFNKNGREIIPLLLKYGAEIDAPPPGETKSALIKAIEWGNHENALILIEAGANVNGVKSNSPWLDVCPLDIVTYGMTTERIFSSRLDTARYLGKTAPTMEMIKQGNYRIAAALLARGANPNGMQAEKSFYEFPLYNAVKSGDVAMAALLLRHGAYVNVRTKLVKVGGQSYTPFEECVKEALDYNRAESIKTRMQMAGLLSRYASPEKPLIIRPDVAHKVEPNHLLFCNVANIIGLQEEKKTRVQALQQALYNQIQVTATPADYMPVAGESQKIRFFKNILQEFRKQHEKEFTSAAKELGRAMPCVGQLMRAEGKNSPNYFKAMPADVQRHIISHITEYHLPGQVISNFAAKAKENKGITKELGKDTVALSNVQAIATERAKAELTWLLEQANPALKAQGQAQRR